MGQPGFIWQSNIPSRHAVTNDEIYVGSYIFQDSTGASATYLTDNMSVLSPTAGAITYRRQWLGSSCGFDWTTAAHVSSSFASINCDLKLGANDNTTNNVTLYSGSAGQINLLAGSGGVLSPIYYGGSLADSTLTLNSTSNGTPSGDVLGLHASSVVVNTLSGSGTATLQIGNGNASKLVFTNATSGTISVAPPTGGLGTVTLTLPDATDTLTGKATTDILLNKTLASSTDVLGGVTTTLGSDATGDIYYRNSGGQLARLGVCTGTNVVGAAAGLPACVTQTGGLGGAMTYLCTITASASASINNASPTSGTCPLNNSYTSYVLVFQNLLPATNERIMELQIHISGSGYKTTGYVTSNIVAANSTVGSSVGNGVNYIAIGHVTANTSQSIGNTSPGVSGQVTITNPSVSSKVAVNGTFSYLGGGGAGWQTFGSFFGYWDTAGVVDGFQVLMDSGNLTSGSILVYGIT